MDRTQEPYGLLQVEIDFTPEELAAIASEAGLLLSPSQQDFAELAWLKPLRLRLLVKIQV